MSRCTKYAEDVVSGRVVAGKYVVQACKRHLKDLQKSTESKKYPYFFDDAAVDDVIEFCGYLRHYKGPIAGRKFKPEPWQEFILGAIFGWKQREITIRVIEDYEYEIHLRRYRYAYIEIARKNGKTFLAAAVALYMLIFDNEAGAEVYSAATTRDQAKICWRDTRSFILKEPELLDMVQVRTLEIAYPPLLSSFVPLSSDAGTLDGLNPHCVICDELHAWPNRDLWDIIEDAFGARDQPLMFIITTAGKNRHCLCYQQRTHGTKILESEEKDGQYLDDSYFVYIATLDETDDRYDKSVWIKSNPNLGVSKYEDFMLEQSVKAQRMSSKEITFLVKQLNIWTTVVSRWLNMEIWEKGKEPMDYELFRGKRCYAGIDLSTNTDLTCICYLFPPSEWEDEKFRALARFFHPEENLEDRIENDKVPYDKWVESGHITLTPGNSVDILFIEKQIKDDSKHFTIMEIGYDPYKAIVLTNLLEYHGFAMMEIRQGHATLGFPTSYLEKLVLDGMFIHGGNPVLTWNAENTVVVSDANENIKPDKKNSTERIDGISATINALAIWCHYNIDYGDVKTF